MNSTPRRFVGSGPEPPLRSYTNSYYPHLHNSSGADWHSTSNNNYHHPYHHSDRHDDGDDNPNILWSGRTPYVRYVDNKGKYVWCIKGIDPHRLHHHFPDLKICVGTSPQKSMRSDPHHTSSSYAGGGNRFLSVLGEADPSALLLHCWRPKRDPHTGNIFFVNMYVYRQQQQQQRDGGGPTNLMDDMMVPKRKVWVLPDIYASKQSHMSLEQQHASSSSLPSGGDSFVTSHIHTGAHLTDARLVTSPHHQHSPLRRNTSGASRRSATGGFTITSVVDPIPHNGSVLHSSSPSSSSRNMNQKMQGSNNRNGHQPKQRHRTNYEDDYDASVVGGS